MGINNFSEKKAIRIYEKITDDEDMVEAYFRQPQIQECCEIRFPSEILSVNIIDEINKDDSALLAKISQQWLSEYDFHLVPFTCTLDVDRAYRIENLEIRLQFNRTDTSERPIVVDLYPRSRIEKSSKNFRIELGAAIQTSFVGFVKKEDSGQYPTRCMVQYDYHYSPQICVIESGGINTSEVFWNINHYNGIYPSGDINTVLMLRRPRNTNNIKLYVNAEAIFSNSNFKRFFTKKHPEDWDQSIEVRFRPS